MSDSVRKAKANAMNMSLEEYNKKFPERDAKAALKPSTPSATGAQVARAPSAGTAPAARPAAAPTAGAPKPKLPGAPTATATPAAKPPAPVAKAATSAPSARVAPAAPAATPGLKPLAAAPSARTAPAGHAPAAPTAKSAKLPPMPGMPGAAAKPALPAAKAAPSARAPVAPAAPAAKAPAPKAPAPKLIVDDDDAPAPRQQAHRPQAYDDDHKLLGDILVEMGSVEQPQVEEALKKQSEDGSGMLGEILIEMGALDQNQLMAALCEQSGLDVADLSTIEADAAIIALVPSDMARLYRFVPLYQEGDKLVIAIADPTNLLMLDDLKFMLSRSVEAMGADPEIIDSWIAKHYPEESQSMEDILGSMESDLEQLDEVDPNSIDSSQIEKMTNAAPVVKYLNMVLLTAIKDQASDVHFEPFESEFRIRYRIDGTLLEIPPPPRNLAVAITSRIKVMANMDIAERRLPQDNKIELTIQGNRIDLRVSTLPTVFGESVVMRILDRSVVQLNLEKLGMREDELQYFYKTIEQPNGIVLVTGPTGSGKTTTLYAALSKVNSPEIKIITTEDPVEYDIDGLVQVQVNDEIEVTFSKCLRAILRQDPDKVLVGEIRDIETASIAIEASLTGHLVFSTLHTNDAPSSITRLIDLGVEAFLVSATLDSIVAQRLVRKICTQCRTEYQPTEEALMEIELTPELVENKRFWFGKKCKNCNNTGYRGRAAIYEILKVNQQLRELIVLRKSTEVIRETARSQGMRTLRESGILKIFDGITTVDEVVRETLAFD